MKLVLDALLSQYPSYSCGFRGDTKVASANNHIEAEVKLFEREVWFNGLQDFARGASTKGTSLGGFPDGHTLMCYTMCGRAAITIESPVASVSVLTDETSQESCMGLNGLDGTEEQVIGLLRWARDIWAEQHHMLREDSDVSLLGFGSGRGPQRNKIKRRVVKRRAARLRHQDSQVGKRNRGRHDWYREYVSLSRYA